MKKPKYQIKNFRRAEEADELEWLEEKAREGYELVSRTTTVKNGTLTGHSCVVSLVSGAAEAAQDGGTP